MSRPFFISSIADHCNFKLTFLVLLLRIFSRVEIPAFFNDEGAIAQRDRATVS